MIKAFNFITEMAWITLISIGIGKYLHQSDYKWATLGVFLTVINFGIHRKLDKIIELQNGDKK